MQIRRLLTGAFALILVLGVAATARAQAQVSTGIVTGRVYNKATNEYLAGAQVSVEGTTLTTTTTAGGEVDIAGVPAGTATLHVVYPDTDPTDVTVAVSAGQSVSQEIGITNITLAKDGAEAFDQLKKKPVHLIISDQYMPNLDGLGLLKAVRTNAPTAKVGFILVTGSPEKSLVDRGRAMGLNNFIAKPFTTKAIRAAIEAVVGRLT